MFTLFRGKNDETEQIVARFIGVLIYLESKKWLGPKPLCLLAVSFIHSAIHPSTHQFPITFHAASVICIYVCTWWVLKARRSNMQWHKQRALALQRGITEWRPTAAWAMWVGELSAAVTCLGAITPCSFPCLLWTFHLCLWSYRQTECWAMFSKERNTLWWIW